MDLEDRTLLVTGGAGFLGSHLVDQLLDRGAREVRVLDDFSRGTRENLDQVRDRKEVTILEGDVADPETVRDAARGVDGIYHLAALWLDGCVERPRDALRVNVEGTFNVAEAARDLDVERVVFSSSASVYGDAVEVPMTEDHPFNNRTMYGATKISGEQIFRSFNDMYDLDYVGLRYMNIYGPRMDDMGTYVSVIVKVLQRIHDGDPPIIHGDGTQTYDFVHVDDVARCNVLAMEADATDTFYNVGADQPATINELVDLLLELTGSDLEPEYEPQEEVYVTHRVGSTDRAADELGFTADIDLRTGLETVVEWWTDRHGDPGADA